MMTLGQQQVRETLEAGATVCALNPEGKKCLIVRNFTGKGYLVGYPSREDLVFWEQKSTLRRYPNMSTWEVELQEAITNDWTMVKLYRPDILVDPPASETRY